MKTKNKTEATQVHKYRKMGYRVRVSHDMVPDIVELNSGEYRHVRGKCYVTVSTPDGKEAMGDSLCVELNYDKRMAIRVALGRAIKSLKLGKQLIPTWKELN